MSGASQVRGRGGQGPPVALDPYLFADLFKPAITQVVKQEFSAAVFGVLKTLRHHARGIQMPQIQLFGVVPANEQVEQSVAVIVEPNGTVCINPRRQPGSFAHTTKAAALVVVEKLGPAPLDQE